MKDLRVTLIVRVKDGDRPDHELRNVVSAIFETVPRRIGAYASVVSAVAVDSIEDV
jgi:hypothetical protein